MFRDEFPPDFKEVRFGNQYDDAPTPPEILEKERLDGTRPSDALIQEMSANPDAMSRWIEIGPLESPP